MQQEFRQYRLFALSYWAVLAVFSPFYFPVAAHHKTWQRIPPWVFIPTVRPARLTRSIQQCRISVAGRGYLGDFSQTLPLHWINTQARPVWSRSLRQPTAGSLDSSYRQHRHWTPLVHSVQSSPADYPTLRSGFTTRVGTTTRLGYFRQFYPTPSEDSVSSLSFLYPSQHFPLSLCQFYRTLCATVKMDSDTLVETSSQHSLDRQLFSLFSSGKSESSGRCTTNSKNAIPFVVRITRE